MLLYSCFSFFFSWYGTHRDLHSFPTRRSSDLELFEDYPERVRLFGEWRQRRDAWAAAERPARQTRDLFARVYELYNQIRSEEHTSELQSQSNLVCRLLLEKKKTERIDTSLDAQ